MSCGAFRAVVIDNTSFALQSIVEPTSSIILFAADSPDGSR
jgi:hypothetical protein